MRIGLLGRVGLAMKIALFLPEAIPSLLGGGVVVLFGEVVGAGVDMVDAILGLRHQVPLSLRERVGVRGICWLSLSLAVALQGTARDVSCQASMPRSNRRSRELDRFGVAQYDR